MTDSKRIVENIKNVILVVLFLTTILLLYLLWSGDSSSPIVLSDILPFIEKESDAPEWLDVIVPEYLAVGSGDGSFKVEYQDMTAVRDESIAILAEIYEGTLQVYTITEDQYNKAMSQYACAIIGWPADLPYQEFCQKCGIESSAAEGIDFMSSLAYSDAAGDSVFIHDAVNKLHYRLALEGADFARPVITGDAAGQSAYYPASVILGCSSSALIPISEHSSQQVCRYARESDDERTRISIAEGIFGDTFDFVRRMTDDFGTVTYMYGYGQKTLTVLQDGSYEYKAETSGESQGFFGDLETALKFVAQCGGWGGEDQGISYRLVEAEEKGTQRDRSCTFGFAGFIGDNRIYAENGLPLVVTVKSGSISYYYRNAVTLAEAEAGETAPVCDAANVIASNAGHMYKVENNDALSPDTDEAFSVIADSVDSVSMGYYLFEGDDSLLPCWVVRLSGGDCFFFDLYGGSPLGFSK